MAGCDAGFSCCGVEKAFLGVSDQIKAANAVKGDRMTGLQIVEEAFPKIVHQIVGGSLLVPVLGYELIDEILFVDYHF